MKLSQTWLNETFDHHNQTYFIPLFGTELKRPTFIIKCLKRYGGYFNHKNGQPIIAMSNFREYTEQGNSDTLLHEMIHEYIWQVGIKDNKTHGKEFMRILNTLKAHGAVVSPRVLPQYVIGYDNAPQEVILLAYLNQKGRYFVCRVSPSKVDLFWDFMVNKKPQCFINPYMLTSKKDMFKSWRTCRSRFVGYTYNLKEFNWLLKKCKVVKRATTLCTK